MYLRGIANRAAQGIRRDESVNIKRSTGSSMGPGLKLAAQYAPLVPVVAQIQALSGAELRLVEGLNIQGTFASIYVDGVLKAVERPSGVGGDLIIRADSTPWLVVAITENWGNWTKAVICLQSA